MLFFALLLTALTLFGCEGYSDSPEALQAKAEQIAHNTIILDGHIDVPYRLTEKMADISKATDDGEFDHPRAKRGGLDVPFMSIYIPAALQQTPGASKKHADMLIALMDSIITANPDKFAHGHTTQQVEENFRNGLISLPYGMENGSGIEDDLANLAYFHKQGVRYITLTHSKKNQICDSSYDDDKGWNGLSPFGRKVIAEMNRLGIMVDISHVSDSTFYQVLRLTKVPVICSHSSLRHFTPGFERNVTDDMLKKLAANGGVIQINFGSSFLTEDANKYGTKFWAHRSAFMEKHGITNGQDSTVVAEMDRYKKESPFPYASIEDVINHIDYAVKLVGIDHVGLGSDFDGVGDSLPTGLKSVADYPNIIAHLLKRGYTEQDIQKILSGNVLRVWKAVEQFAQQAPQNP